MSRGLLTRYPPDRHLGMLFAAILPVFSTLLGGYTALRLAHRLHPIMAFAAGVLVTTAFADLAPEAFATAGVMPAAIAMTAGFLLYSILESAIEQGSHEHADGVIDLADPSAHQPHPRIGLLAMPGLIAHSTMDGVAIGAGFGASPSLGVLITMAVVAHDFADGLNVVTIALAGGAHRKLVRVFLVADAVAVPVGVAIGSAAAPSGSMIGVLLGFFAGVFVAVGAGHLLPEARHGGSAGAGVVVPLIAGSCLVLALRLVLG